MTFAADGDDEAIAPEEPETREHRRVRVPFFPTYSVVRWLLPEPDGRSCQQVQDSHGRVKGAVPAGGRPALGARHGFAARRAPSRGGFNRQYFGFGRPTLAAIGIDPPMVAGSGKTGD